jgi:hypothetical protein
MVTNDMKERYKDILAQAGGNQEVLAEVYKGAIKQLAEMQVTAKLEVEKRDLIVDLLILAEIVEMTAEVFDKTSVQVTTDIMVATESLPIDDIQQAHDLKQSGMLN